MDTEEKLNKPEEHTGTREHAPLLHTNLSNYEERLRKLEELVYDADALTEILHEILNANRENKGMVKLCYLSEHIRKKFKEIRDVF